MSGERAGAPAKWQETTHLVNSGGPWAKKSRNLQADRKRRIWGDKVSWRQTKKGGKRQESLVLKYNLFLIMLSLE